MWGNSKDLTLFITKLSHLRFSLLILLYIVPWKFPSFERNFFHEISLFKTKNLWNNFRKASTIQLAKLSVNHEQPLRENLMPCHVQRFQWFTSCKWTIVRLKFCLKAFLHSRILQILPFSLVVTFTDIFHSISLWNRFIGNCRNLGQI